MFVVATSLRLVVGQRPAGLALPASTEHSQVATSLWLVVGQRHAGLAPPARTEHSKPAPNLWLVVGRRGAGLALVIDEPSQHATDVILSAKKHCQDADGLVFFIHVKPIDRAMDRQMP